MRMYPLAAAALAVGLVLGTGVSVTAQTTDRETQTTPARQSPADARFMVQAAQSDLTEIRTSQLALQRSTDPEVREYAQRMIEEHTRSSSQLKELAQKKNVTLPNELNPKQQALYDKLSKLQGAEFDRAYMQGQVTAHNDTAKVYRDYLSQGKDPQVRDFARTVLPIVENHERVARTESGNVAETPAERDRPTTEPVSPNNETTQDRPYTTNPGVSPIQTDPRQKIPGTTNPDASNTRPPR